MRPLEIAVVVVLLPYVLHLLSPSRGDNLLFSLIPLVAVSLMLCQVVVEGYRWQMIPAYLLAIIFIAYESARMFSDFRFSYNSGAIALVLLFSAIVFSTALPIFILPAPTGPYKIGTVTRYLVDNSRRDPYSDLRDGPRELMIQIWYPAEPSAQGPISSYRDRRITTQWDARFALVKSHSIFGAKLLRSQSSFPVLLYSPSWDGIRTESSFLVEELASHGYIVFGIDHPYSSRITAFPDGRVAHRKFLGEEDYSSPARFQAFVGTANQQVEIRVRDVKFVLDTLETLAVSDPDGLFTGHLDLSRIGIFGASFGGTTAAEACWLDRRVKAGVDMGGMIAGRSAKEGTIAPFLYFFEDEPPSVPAAELLASDPRKRREIEFAWQQFAQIKRSLSEFGGYMIIIHGLRHINFFDAPFFSPVRNHHVDPERVVEIIRRYTVAFFDKYLKKIEQPLLDEPPTSDPEIHIEAWKNKTPLVRLGL
jgi:dienelactone hydrolase